MTTDRDIGPRIEADPGQVVGATGSGSPETREAHHSMDNAERARARSRRNFLRGAAGAGALFLVGSLGTAFLRGRDDPRDEVDRPGNTLPDTPESPSNPNTVPAFEKDLTLRRMALPETLDPPTFSEAVTNLGTAIQYAVNTNDAELLDRLIPGGINGGLSSGQFKLRAAFFEGFRKSSIGIANDNPHNPNDARYYPWGFAMELLEPLNRKGQNPHSPDVTSFVGRVRISMGDLPPLPNMPPHSAGFEPPKEFETELALTRYSGLDKSGRYVELPNLDGQPGRGWGIANVSQMYPIPKIMSQHLPKEFTEVPPLFT